MSKSKKITNELIGKKTCPSCHRQLPALPPCPICGSEIPSFMDLELYQEIMKFLQHHKGSQARIYLGKKDREPILVYELLTKKQLENAEL